MEHSTHPAPGLITSLAGVARNSMRLVLSRIELAALELSEVRNHLVQLSVVFALAVVAGWFAVAFAAVTIVYLAWEAMGWKILLLMTGAFIVMLVALVMYAKGLLKQDKLTLHTTMAELKADRDMLL
ncbi:MAG: phage holin family protein [Pseudomonadota bacterium]